MRILIVDDHATNRLVVEFMLDEMGVAHASAGDGAAAVEAVGASAFDAILMDVQMPVMDGITAVQTIRARERDLGLARTPIIMLTANAQGDCVRSCARAGADGHLSKPFTAASLHRALTSALSEPAQPAVALPEA